MTPPLSAATIFIIIIILITSPPVSSLGSTSTIAIISSSNSSASSTVCGITAAGGSATASEIKCYKNGQVTTISPNTSYESISGGRDFFCGLTSGGLSLLCWDTTIFRPRRIYAGHPLTDLTAGEYHVCAIQSNTSLPLCWRFRSPEGSPELRSITSGNGFSCGILKNNGRVICWGENEIGNKIEPQFGNFTMSSLIAGESHVCGVTKSGSLICRGKNSNGQLNVPLHKFLKSSGLALGENYTCAIQKENGLVICWGGGVDLSSSFELVKNISFESIVASSDLFCGLTTKNLSIICWGLGFSNSLINVPLPMIIPGPCVQSSCEECGLYPNSYTLCGGFGNICKPCDSLPELPILVIPPPKPPPSTTKTWRFLVFCLVGSMGGFAGICTILYIVWKVFVRKENLHNAAQISANSTPFNACLAAKGNISGKLRRDKSGSSAKYSESTKYSEKLNLYSLPELIAATNDFSERNMIGAGSFGSVFNAEIYGRQVAIKKSDNSSKIKKFQERETAFSSELVLLSRVHHKHLVELVGFCEERDEMILVYEYMRNGSLHDHLHSKRNLENRAVLDSWKMRIKIALDAAKGIEYLHNYAVPPIIHRDIKSSNILLDKNFTAKISDFGLSVMGPDSDQESISIDAVGTAGYIDPEYYVLKILTVKSDVYGFGVVLLEILTGKRAVFKEEGGGPVTVVEYVRDRILGGGLGRLLDKRVGSPEMGEVEAIEVVGFLALSCVSMEGKERPSVSEVVAKLEKAFYLCEDKDFSVSSTPISFYEISM